MCVHNNRGNNMIRHKKLVTLKGQKVENSRENIFMALSHPWSLWVYLEALNTLTTICTFSVWFFAPDEEKLLKNQELLLGIISFTLVDLNIWCRGDFERKNKTRDTLRTTSDTRLLVWMNLLFIMHIPL